MTDHDMTEHLLTSVDERWRSAPLDGVRSLLWSPSNRLLAVGADGRAMIDQPHLTTAPMAPDPVDAAWRGEHRVVVVDAVAGAVFAGSGSVESHEIPGARCVGVGGGRTVVAGNGELVVFDAVDSNDPRRVPTGVGQTHSLHSLGGALWAVGGAEGLALVDVSINCVDDQIAIGGVRSIGWAPETERVVMLDGLGDVCLVHLAQPTTTCNIETANVRHLAIGRNGDVLTTVSDRRLTWWALESGRSFSSRPIDVVDHEATVTALAMSDRGMVATGQANGALNIWSPHVRREPVAQVSLDAEIVAIDWTGCGRQLAAASMTGEIVVLDVREGSIA